MLKHLFVWITTLSTLITTSAPAVAAGEQGSTIPELIRLEEEALNKDLQYLREIKEALATAQWHESFGFYTFGGGILSTTLIVAGSTLSIRRISLPLLRVLSLLSIVSSSVVLGGSIKMAIAGRDVKRLQKQVERDEIAIVARIQRLRKLKAELGLGPALPQPE